MRFAHAAVAAALAGSAAAAPDGPADLVIRSAQVVTMDPARPVASAVVVRDRRVVYVGDDAGAGRFRGPTIDGRGGLTVLPGLIDAHAHLLGLGLALSRLDLRGKDSPQAVAEAVREALPRTREEWVLGRGWDQNRFPRQALPTLSDRRLLDAVAARRPVWLRRIDGHAGWANGEALRRAGIGRDTKDVPGGRVLRGPDGEATGVLVDNAMEIVDRAVPAPAPAVLEQAILGAAQHAVRLGLTGVHEMGIGPQEAAAYLRLAAAGRLPLRVYAFAADPVPARLAQAAGTPGYQAFLDGLPQRLGAPASGPFFSLRGIKLYADGALGSRGAALLADYSDEPGNRGLLLAPPAHIEAMARWGAAHGYQIATHAIGDRGNRLVLDAYERAGVRPERGLRFRVEHAQVVAPADQPRFYALGVIASVQPTHATSDMPWAESRLGAQRIADAYAWQDLLHAGARLCAGSDFPVEEADPRLGLFAAMTRTDLQGARFPDRGRDQRLSPGEAVRAFTVDAAYAAFAEDRLGQLRPGRPADLTVLAGRLGDLAGPAPEDLPRRPVRLTVVDGKVVYDGQQPEAPKR